MALLDDLQHQVEKIQEEKLERQVELEAQEEFYDVQLRPAMSRARDYLAEIIDNLRIVVPQIYPSYPLNPQLQKGVTLKQIDYEFDYDNGKSPRQLVIRCSCILEQPHQFDVKSKDAVLQHTDLLESYRFPYHRKDYRDKRHDVRSATFTLEGPMRVYIRLLADAVDRCIYIDLRNIEQQAVKRYKFSPQQIDDVLLERLAQLLVRKESLLVNVEVSTNVRDELRRKLEIEKRRDEEDLARGLAILEAEKLAAEEARPINRARRAAASGVDKVLTMVKKFR
jgi:hypothetical protein